MELNEMRRGIVFLGAFGMSLCGSQSFAQSNEEWSLEPLGNSFPCDTVQQNPNGVVFVKPLKITCNGRAFLNPLAGSSYGVSYACDRTIGVILLDQNAMQKHPNHLMQVIKKDCSR
jgi:hypothetical protein